MRIITLMSVFLLVLMILNCSDKNSSGPDNSQSDLVVSFSRSLHKEAYIILHSLDGQEVKSIQTIGTNEIATFQGIDESRVTFTVIFQDTSHSRYDKNVCFLSYFNVPINQYLLNGPSGPILGYADVTLDSPDSSYSRSLVSIPHYGKASSSTASKNFEVRKLCSNGKLTLFASLINSDELFGFYGWLQDQGFEYNFSNEYTITLNNPLQIKVLQTNLPITDYSLGALLNPYGEQGGSPNLYFWQDTDFRRNFESEYTEFSLFYAPYFPKDYYNLNVSYH
ncbi:MAG: hypothetical protein K8R73_02910, partial [Clostridiales bacterium]|nr:hypothetical protein [Clostridiales bacterium]